MLICISFKIFRFCLQCLIYKVHNFARLFDSLRLFPAFAVLFYLNRFAPVCQELFSFSWLPVLLSVKRSLNIARISPSCQLFFSFFSPFFPFFKINTKYSMKSFDFILYLYFSKKNSFGEVYAVSTFSFYFVENFSFFLFFIADFSKNYFAVSTFSEKMLPISGYRQK